MSAMSKTLDSIPIETTPKFSGGDIYILRIQSDQWLVHTQHVDRWVLWAEGDRSLGKNKQLQWYP